eukprot:247195-Amphidinium_carterae.2
MGTVHSLPSLRQRWHLVQHCTGSTGLEGLFSAARRTTARFLRGFEWYAVNFRRCSGKLNGAMVAGGAATAAFK